MAPHTTHTEIGQARKRTEDERFLTGNGRYVDDIVFDGMVYAVILRSPHAHARVRSVDTEDAVRGPGVLAVLTGKDQAAAQIASLPPAERANEHTGEPFAYTPYPPLATDRVRHVGQPVALVVARTVTEAQDAAECIRVDYDPLPAVTTAEAALAGGAVQLSDDIPGNIILEWQTGDAAATRRAFDGAAHVTRLDVDNHRIVTNPMEPRGAIGVYDGDADAYTLHVSSQSIHAGRDNIAAVLGIPPERLRFVAPDVGGGFGTKNFSYVENILTLWAARTVKAPVKWINERGAGFVSDHQARDHRATAELALDATDKFLALRVGSWANVGAYLCGSSGRVPLNQYIAMPNTVYRIPALHLTIGAVTTNTVPIGVTRGPGFAESVNILERLIDRAAREMQIDRADLRRRNLIGADAMPYTNTTGTTIDSGDFTANLDAALEYAHGFADRRRASEARSLRRGLGFAYHIKGTGGAPEEKVEIRFGDDDTVTLTTGTQSIGQGHETTFPQIVSGRLGVPFGRVRYRQGDTAIISKGGGHGSSRSTYMGGTAIYLATEKIIEKGRRVAARAMEAAEADIEFADGQFRVGGTDRVLDLLTVARIARESGTRSEDGDIGLDTPQEYIREAMTYPNGCHIAEVEIDPETGTVAVVRYAAVDDYGAIINPMVAEGQVHGAIAQGIGQALMEHAVYQPETGQLLSASFMDYAMPRAADLPSFDVAFNGTNCTTNPLGVKGCGEAGAVAAYPAVTSAIGDALASLNAIGDPNEFAGPATPERIWRAINGMAPHGG
ncbi:MAG: xanthine dehydrogenase family protein molybdopterin-binding subunit [Alphaproteobacteria bacterium]|nr:xanthine dehydrogenase family protein molybdopterin-binding subunit [Alphaproteobacteria bacterium]